MRFDRRGGWLGTIVATVVLASSPGAAVAAAEPEPPTTYRARRASSPVVVDGVLDDAVWADAEAIPLPFEYDPGDNVPAPVATEARIVFDADRIWVAFRCFDPEPGKIRAHLMDRDDVDAFVRDDHVTVLLDTFADRRRAFQFRVNPLGVQMDAIFSEAEGIEDFSWDLIWDSAGRIDDLGWTVEIGIPVRQLRFPPGDGERTWGVALTRSYPRSVRSRISATRQDRSVQCVLCQTLDVAGFEGLAAGRNLELDPTLTATRTDAAEAGPGSNLVAGDEDVEAGLTARWSPTPNLAVGAAVDPDFSQIEADAAQLSINERFALFFPEKRPFFLEGTDLFSTPIQAVFTRTVADPAWGLKVTGKSGRSAYGAFVTRDRVNNLVIPANETSAFVSSEDPGSGLDGDVDGLVGRYRRDVGRQHSVGVLYAGREAGDYRNRVAGADGFFQVGDKDRLRVQWLRSETRYPDPLAAAFEQPEGSFSDDATWVEWIHGGPHVYSEVAWRDYGDGFRADSGFLPRVGFREASAFGRYRWYSRGTPWFTTLDLQGYVVRSEDRDGEPSDRHEQIGVNYRGPLQSRVYLEASRTDRRFDGVLHEGLDNTFALFEIQPTGNLRIEAWAGAGDGIDYAGNREGEQFEGAVEVGLRFGRRFSVDLQHEVRALDLDGGRLFRADLSQARAFWHFSVRSFLRAIVQREAIEREPTLWPFPVERDGERWFAQALYSFKLNPQTVAFAGYSETRAGGDGLDLAVVERAFFVKLGYAWLL